METWFVLNTTNELGYDRSEFVKSVLNAFDKWSQTGLEFYQHESCLCKTKIRISVKHTTHYMEDTPCAAFGENILAHASYPPIGDIHIRSELNLSLWYPKLNVPVPNYWNEEGEYAGEICVNEPWPTRNISWCLSDKNVIPNQYHTIKTPSKRYSPIN